jgi:hypothetical protein
MKVSPRPERPFSSTTTVKVQGAPPSVHVPVNVAVSPTTDRPVTDRLRTRKRV